MASTNSKQTVVYICPNGFIGGAERFVLNACSGHLERQLWHPHIIFFNDGPACELARQQGISTTVLSTRFRLARPHQLGKAMWEMRRHMQQIRPAVVHFTMPYSVLTAYLPTISVAAKRVWFQHGPIGGSLDWLANLLPHELILFNSTYLRQLHSQMPDLHPQTHQVVNLGIAPSTKNTSEVARIRAELLTGEQRLLVCMAGRICSWKGIHLFLQAIKALEERSCHQLAKICFAIIGAANSQSDKDYLRALENQAKQLNTQVKFLGHQSNIADYLWATDILVHASTIPEPFGLIVAEAMQKDCVVIGANSGGVTDILVHGETGSVFDPTANDAYLVLADHIQTATKGLLSDTQQVELLKQQAAKKIEQEYSLSQMVRQLEDLYGQLLA